MATLDKEDPKLSSTTVHPLKPPEEELEKEGNQETSGWSQNAREREGHSRKGWILCTSANGLRSCQRDFACANGLWKPTGMYSRPGTFPRPPVLFEETQEEN